MGIAACKAIKGVDKPPCRDRQKGYAPIRGVWKTLPTPMPTTNKQSSCFALKMVAFGVASRKHLEVISQASAVVE